MLLKLLFAKLNKSYQQYVQLLKMSITILLFSLANMKQLLVQQKVEESKISETLAHCKKLLKEWIVQREVIGGSFFGGKAEMQVS